MHSCSIEFYGSLVCQRVALHNMMRYDEAIQCYTRALAIDTGECSGRVPEKSGTG